jgi:hypothetical protein
MQYQNETKICQNCKSNFTIESDDFLFYEKMKVPPPTFCPECRRQRRLMWRNERSFYYRNCEMCNNKIISIYKDENIKIFCQNCWFSDNWDALDHGMVFDFNISFFEQFNNLFKKVPQVNLNGHISNINSPYVNYVVQAKNCYFCFGGGFSENVMFSNLAIDCKDSSEIYFSNYCEFCYEISNCNKCYKVFWGNNLRDCIDSYFLQDCANCNECIMCCNLNNKSFCYKNKQYTKEEFYKIKEIFLKDVKNNINNLKKDFKEFLILYPKKYANILKSQNCSGDGVTECNNVKESFNAKKGENLKYCVEVLNNVRDIYDGSSIGLNTENVYEVLTGSINVSNIISSCIIRNNSLDVKYSYFMTSCSNCFACIGLKNKSYCILNKQYTKEQYEELVPKIIKHMSDMPYIDSKGRVYKYGEFFPSELSPFCYNETIAQEYFPLTKEQALEQGYRWKDKEERNYNIDIHSNDIPDDIKDVNDDITNKIIECEHKGTCNQQCTEAFKIIPEELQFYKRINLPLPHLCPNCRHYERLTQRNPLKLWHRTCMKEGCNNEFETSYSPDQPEIVYCEKCYQQEVY